MPDDALCDEGVHTQVTEACPYSTAKVMPDPARHDPKTDLLSAICDDDIKLCLHQCHAGDRALAGRRRQQVAVLEGGKSLQDLNSIVFGVGGTS
jgi:hypothetical protein